MLDQVLEKTLGIIWITRENLGSELPFFEELNYLSNNLLIKNKRNYHPTKNFYLTSSFNKPFFIAHLLEREKLKDDLLNVLEMTKEIAEAGKEVLVLSSDEKILSFLSKKSSSLSFVTLNK